MSSITLDAMEEWREVPGYEGYRVSNTGSVVGRKGGLLRQSPQRTGHLTVALGHGKTVGVHVAVALAFIGPKPPGTVCCHNDGNPTNNSPENLRWDTKSGDCKDRALHGRNTVGPRNGQAKLTWRAAGEIRAAYAAGGISMKRLGERYGIKADAVHMIVHNRAWKVPVTADNL